MGTTGIKIKIMPISPKSDLKQIEDEVRTLIEEKDAKNCKFEQEPIAFGLKAIITFFEWPEEQEIDELENELKQIKDVNSVQIIDMRRLI